MIHFTSVNPNRLLIRGILAACVGIVIIAIPGFTMKTFMQFMGLFLLADGLIAFLIDYFTPKQQSTFLLVPRGISKMIVGLVLIVFPSILLNVFVFVIGILLLLAGTSQLMSQLGTRGRLKFSLPMLIFSLVSLLAGATLLFNPFESARFIMVFFGVVTFIYGMGEVFWSFKIRKLKPMQQNEHPHVVDAEYTEVEQ